MAIQEGQKIPAVDVMLGTPDGPQPINTQDLLGSGRVVLFGVPGAFTPTCSQAHLPGYVVHRDAFKDKGVQRVVCMAVNDAFVMAAWGAANNADAIDMLADGNGDFTRALGLEMDASGFGMGTRCKRFALIAEDGVVKALFVEAPKQFEVSTAEHVLAHL